MENVKAEIYISKSGDTVSRKIYILIFGAEFTREFYTKKELKNMLDFLKYHNIKTKIFHSNYNCSYMDLPF